jgi:hypothetical protein
VTPARMAGRQGGSRVPTPALHGPASRAAARLAILVVLVALFAAACGNGGPVVPTLAPLSPAASGSGGVAPVATPWIGSAVFGIEALGIADGQIGQATSDLSAAIANEDLAKMRSAAAGLAGVDVLLPNMDKLRQEPAMRSFADRYETAIKAVSAGGKALVAAIDKGDAKAIASSTQDLLDGLKLYTALQGELANWVEQMPEQKRMLTQ